jgi:arginine-tRNA-protein transferase
VTIEPASFSEEKFLLYKKYQMAIHGDKESKVTEKGFTRFLCDSPLKVSLKYRKIQYS